MATTSTRSTKPSRSTSPTPFTPPSPMAPAPLPSPTTTIRPPSPSAWSVRAAPSRSRPPTVTLRLSGSPIAEAAGVATVTATLSAPSGLAVTVDLAFSGTATLTNDYMRSGASIVIPPGSTNGTITLTAVQDSLDEVDETIIVDISNVTNGTESGIQQVTATITDDDLPPVVAFNASTSNGSESITSASVPVSLSSASGKSVTVNYAVTGGTATGGGVDYTLASGT